MQQQDSYTDQLISKIKNNRVAAAIILLFVFLTSLATLLGSIKSIRDDIFSLDRSAKMTGELPKQQSDVTQSKAYDNDNVINNIIAEFYNSKKALMVVTAYVRYTTGDYKMYVERGKEVAEKLATNFINRGVSTKRVRWSGSCYKGKFDKSKYANLIEFFFDYTRDTAVTIRFSDPKIYMGPSITPYSPQDLDQSTCLIESKYG